MCSLRDVSLLLRIIWQAWFSISNAIFNKLRPINYANNCLNLWIYAWDEIYILMHFILYKVQVYRRNSNFFNRFLVIQINGINHSGISQFCNKVLLYFDSYNSLIVNEETSSQSLHTMKPCRNSQFRITISMSYYILLILIFFTLL